MYIKSGAHLYKILLTRQLPPSPVVYYLRHDFLLCSEFMQQPSLFCRLHENVRSHTKSTPPGGLGRSDTEDNLPGPVSRSSSIASLNARKHVGSAAGIPASGGGAPEEAVNQVRIIALYHIMGQ